MKWVLRHTNDELQTWILTGHEPITELKFNQQVHSFRLHSGEKRLFFLEKTGFVQTRLLLKTEYSIVIGEIHFFKNFHSGVVFFEDNKYHYRLNDTLLELQSLREGESFSIEIERMTILDQFSLAALVFSTCRILISELKAEEMAFAF